MINEQTGDIMLELVTGVLSLGQGEKNQKTFNEPSIRNYLDVNIPIPLVEPDKGTITIRLKKHSEDDNFIYDIVNNYERSKENFIPITANVSMKFIDDRNFNIVKNYIITDGQCPKLKQSQDNDISVWEIKCNLKEYLLPT